MLPKMFLVIFSISCLVDDQVESPDQFRHNHLFDAIKNRNAMIDSLAPITIGQELNTMALPSFAVQTLALT